MSNPIYILICLFTIYAMMASCSSEPKVVEGQPIEQAITPNSLPSLEGKTSASPSTNPSTEIREVVVEEILTTDKYNYLYVSEKDQKFWIAISKAEVKVGNTYYFQGGLLKKNFFSREFNRVFDTVYLVSKIWEQPDGNPVTTPAIASSTPAVPNLEVGEIKAAPGSVSLKDLFSQKENYNSKVIKVTGKCVKVNPKIMQRNWLHIQDGSGEGLDLTVTTQENIPLGAVVTMEGTITLDKDFGAGYRYDIIMEGAVSVK